VIFQKQIQIGESELFQVDEPEEVVEEVVDLLHSDSVRREFGLQMVILGKLVYEVDKVEREVPWSVKQKKVNWLWNRN